MRTNPLAVPLVAVFSVVGAYGIITAASANLRDKPMTQHVAAAPATPSQSPSAQAVEAAQPLAASATSMAASAAKNAPSAGAGERSPGHRPAATQSTPVVGKNLAATPGLSARAFIDQVYELTNDERRRAGLRPLTRSLCLAKGARAWTATMAQRNLLEHQELDWIITRCSFRWAAENIAQGYSSPAALVEGWMKSSGHRQNILNPQFTHFGIGYSIDGHYGTQNFGG